MDAKPIEQQMRLTRARIDRKLDLLAVRATEVQQQSVRSAAVVAAASAVVFAVMWVWRYRRRHVMTRRMSRAAHRIM